MAILKYLVVIFIFPAEMTENQNFNKAKSFIHLIFILSCYPNVTVCSTTFDWDDLKVGKRLSTIEPIGIEEVIYASKLLLIAASDKNIVVVVLITH